MRDLNKAPSPSFGFEKLPRNYIRVIVNNYRLFRLVPFPIPANKISRFKVLQKYIVAIVKSPKQGSLKANM